MVSLIFQKYCSVRTKKLHKIKFKKNLKNLKKKLVIFLKMMVIYVWSYRGRTVIFLQKLIAVPKIILSLDFKTTLKQNLTCMTKTQQQFSFVHFVVDDPVLHTQVYTQNVLYTSVVIVLLQDRHRGVRSGPSRQPELWACTLLCYSAKAYVERVIALSVLFAAALTLKSKGIKLLERFSF